LDSLVFVFVFGFNYIMSIANIIKWIATFITLGGALATALMYDPLNVWLLNLGALLFLIWGVMIKEKAMIAVNLGLLTIYILGLVVRA
jgi:hypothetical protein